MKKVLNKIMPKGTKRRELVKKVYGRINRGGKGFDYNWWIKHIEPKMLCRTVSTCDKTISILLPTFNTPSRYIEPLVKSLIQQTYDRWELCIADGSTDTEASRRIKSLANSDKRIKYLHLASNKGISGNTNEALKMATGDYIAFLDHDDVLPVWALNEVAEAICANPKGGIFYSDEDKLTENGKRVMPFFKPDWSPEFFTSVNYMAHFVVVSKELVNKVGGLKSKYDGAQDYEFLLRLMDHKPTVVHIPKILYHWRMAQGSTARAIGEKSYADEAGQAALRDYFSRNNIKAKVLPIIERPTNYRVQYDIIGTPLVSIIIPFKDKVDLLKTSVGSILSKTKYPNYEIILVSNNSVEKATFTYLKKLRGNKKIKQLEYNKPFNYSAVNNYGRKSAKGSILVFLNNDTKVLQQDWLNELIGVAQQKEVGAVGPMLLYPDQTIQHAGIILGLLGMASHIFRNLLPGTYTFYGTPLWPRNYLAVTGACLVVSSVKFDAVNGFNEEFIVCGSDVTLCLDLYEKGYRNVYWPYVSLTHYESKSVGSYKNIPASDYDLSVVHYKPYLHYQDPYFNLNLDIMSEIPALRKEPHGQQLKG